MTDDILRQLCRNKSNNIVDLFSLKSLLSYLKKFNEKSRFDYVKKSSDGELNPATSVRDC